MHSSLRPSLHLHRLRFFAAQNPEGTPGAPAGDPPAGEDKSAKEFKAPATQADLDRIIEARVARERAQFPDYDALKAKAEKFDQAEADKLPAEERAAKALADATRRADAAEAALAERTLRDEVAGAKGVPAALLTGSTKAEMEAAADALIAFRGATGEPPAPKRSGPYVPTAGQTRDPASKDQSVSAGRALYGELRGTKTP